jgi:hypothetical protein
VRQIRSHNAQFVDAEGRTLMLRGANVSGSSKIPFSPRVEPTDARFYCHREVSYVGRPFPLEEADEHLTRLREWGLTFLRLVVTWEAIEHEGPGLYDVEFLEYIRAVVKKAGEYGFLVLVDPHQDVWSRYTGGDGAPGWTLEAVGFDVSKLSASGAALLHHTHAHPPPWTVWATNYGYLAPATMFTLFFAGTDFAPETRIAGEPAQEFLQRHYTDAFVELARALNGLDCVAGYEVMNEPSRGWIGWRNLHSAGQFRYWFTPSPFQAMLLGDGFMQRVWSRRLNPGQERAWLTGHDDIWRQNGVWENTRRGPRLARPDHFVSVVDQAGRRREVSFARDYFPPFAKRFARAIRQVDPGALIFVQGEPGERAPALTCAELPNLVYAPHWYDGIALMMRRYAHHLGVDMIRRRLVVGAGAIHASFAAQLGSFKQEAEHDFGGVPVLLGEFGIPFDLHNRAMYRSGDYSLALRALDRSFRALEANRMSGAIWNYTPDNTQAAGDYFNGEDLSIFSRSQQSDPSDIHSGGRGLRALVRPYPRATAGELLNVRFDWEHRVFEFEFKHDPLITAPSEVFVPTYQYPRGFQVEVTDGEYEFNARTQILTYRHQRERANHTVRITGQ